MNQIIRNEFISKTEPLNKVGFSILLLIEIILLAFLAFEYSVIAIITVVAIIGVFILYWFYKTPFALVHTFLLSILAGAVETVKISTTKSQLAFVDILFPLLIAMFLIKLFFHASEDEKQKYYLIIGLYGIYLIWSLMTVFIAVDTTLALAYWRNYFAGFILFAYSLLTIKSANQIKLSIILLITWGIVLAILEFSVIITLGGTSEGLMKLFFTKNLLATSWGKSNYLAAFYVLIIPFTVGFLLASKSKITKTVLSFSLLLMFSAVLVTLSKGGILALGVGLSVFVVKAIKPRTIIPILSVIALVAIILLLNPMTYVIFEGLTNVDNSFSTMTRINFYVDTWHAFLNHPLTGVGLGNLGFYALFKISASASAHNIVLGMLGETGIVGALIFLPLLGYAYFRTIKNYYTEKNERIKILLWSFVGAFTGVLVHSMIEPNFEGFQFAVMFWTSLAVFFRLSELSEEEKSYVLGADN
ncbi:MAG: O-antigen ligase family protein [Melioribacteraceae bacterium]|nr:O-antigen ligase family protein [Melioribacteraceae bacterium]